MTVVGNLLCDPNYDNTYGESDDMWAMFAVMEHSAFEDRKFRVKASGAICRRMHIDRLKKGDFIKISGHPDKQPDGKPFLMATEYRLLKKAVKNDR